MSIKILKGRKMIYIIEDSKINEFPGKSEVKSYLQSKYNSKSIIDKQTDGTLTIINGAKITLIGVESIVITDITIP